jgi:hypothetical protein
MSDPHLTLEEFDALFPGEFESREEMLAEYNAFLVVLQQLDRAPVPELSVRERAEIFRRTWPGRARATSATWTSLAFWRRPAVTFALGLVLGCALMAAFTGDQPSPSEPTPAKQAFKVERSQHVEIYEGTVLQRLYPEIENPQMVVEKSPGAPQPRRVLRGTVDNGSVYVVWNL